MFAYFGAKHGAAKRYQPPRHKTIIEPFAGAAGYACYWLQEDSSARAILIDSDQRIVDTWHRILASTPDDIMAWEPPVEGAMSDDLVIVGMGGYSPLASSNPNVISSRMVEDFPSTRRRIAFLRASIGDRIEVLQGNYTDAPGIEATWFIDPPYQDQGSYYNHGSESLDFAALADWCRQRKGQTVVCEAAPADWLPFSVFAAQKSLANTQGVELVWESDPTPTLFDLSQP